MEIKRSIKVGHIFYKNKQLVRLTQDDVDYMYDHINSYEIYQPLPFTHVVLEKLGIKPTPDPRWKPNYYRIGPLIIRWCEVEGHYYHSNCRKPYLIRYMYHLQNMLGNYGCSFNMNLDLDSIDPLKKSYKRKTKK
jgi:hypothetical protein